MWHEARRSERKVHDMMDAARRSAQRRAVFLAKRRGDPQQSLQITGSRCRLHHDAALYQAAQDQQGLNTSHGKHMGGIVTTFKVKGSDAVKDNAVQLDIPKEKRLSMTGPDEKMSWTPEIHFTSSSIRSKCDSEKIINKSDQGLDKCVIEASAWKIEKQLQDGLVVPPTNSKKLNKLIRKQVKDTLGTKWFDMPAQIITPELKKDLQLLKLRNVIDPKRHYKADDSKGLPKYFQVGTVIEPATEFYSARLTKKEHKPTIADELLSNPDLSRYRKRKYAEFDNQKNTVSRKGRKTKKHSRKHGR